MKRMKSKVVKVKVWFDHDPGVPAESVNATIERLTLRSLAQSEGEGVRIHSFEIGSASPPPRRPEPDF